MRRRAGLVVESAAIGVVREDRRAPERAAAIFSEELSVNDERDPRLTGRGDAGGRCERRGPLGLRAFERPDELGVLRQQDGDERGDEGKSKSASQDEEDDRNTLALIATRLDNSELPS